LDISTKAGLLYVCIRVILKAGYLYVMLKHTSCKGHELGLKFNFF